MFNTIVGEYLVQERQQSDRRVAIRQSLESAGLRQRRRLATPTLRGRMRAAYRGFVNGGAAAR